MITEEMQQVINKVNSSWSKDLIIRYLYVKLSPYFRRDLKYFLASEEEKMAEFKKGFVNRGNDIVCSTISDFFVNLFNSYGIKANKIAANSAQIPLFAIIVEGDHGWYFIDPLNDLFKNQYGLKTTEYGSIPHYKTLANNYPYLITLSQEYISDLDYQLDIDKSLNDFFKILQFEMTNRNIVAEHFNLSKENRIGLFQKKMEFANAELINIGNVKGPFERLQLYLFLERMLFFKTEKKALKIFLNTETQEPSPRIEYNNLLSEKTSIFQETKEDNQFVLKKVC